MFLESQNYGIVRTELDRVFYQEFEYDAMQPAIATANTVTLFKPMNIDRAAYIEEIYKGVGLYPTVGEIGQVPVSTPQVANKLTTYVLPFAQGVELSKDLFADQMHNVWSRTVESMALMAKVTQDQNAFKIFRNAFTTTLTADGAALVSASHTLINGSTYSNLVTGALTTDTLNDAIIALKQQPNQANVTLGNAPAYLVVPSKIWKHAIEITDSALTADLANNNLNVYRSNFGIMVYTSPWLDAVNGGSDTAWFLLAKNHSITRLIRQGLETFLRDWGYSSNRTYLYQANFREEVYVPDYIGVVGSTGV
jgi:hypothetical protein